MTWAEIHQALISQVTLLAEFFIWKVKVKGKDGSFNLGELHPKISGFFDAQKVCYLNV